MKTSVLSRIYPLKTWSSDCIVVYPILSDDDDGNSDEEEKPAHPLMSAIQKLGGDGEVQRNMPTQASRVRTSGTYD
jgi:hypothetical protein